MGSSTHHQLQLPPVPVNSLDRPRTNDGAVEGQAVVPPRTTGLTLLVDAVTRSGCSEKEVAIALGCPDAPYWSKVKSGEKPAPRITRLTDAPLPVQREYVRRWGRTLGMRVSDESSQRAAIADLICAAAKAMREVG